MSIYLSILVMICFFTPQLLILHYRAFSLANSKLFYNVYIDIKKVRQIEFSKCLKFSNLLFGFEPSASVSKRLLSDMQELLIASGYKKKVSLVYTLAYFSLLDDARFQYFCGFRLTSYFKSKFSINYNIYRILGLTGAFIIFAIVVIHSVFSMK